MKRLNMVLAVLCDEERRRAYDLSLDAPALDKSVKTNRLDQARAWIERVPRSTWVWAATAALGIIAIGVFFRSPGGEAVPPGRKTEMPVRPAKEVKAKPALVRLPTSQRAPLRIAIPATPEVRAVELPPSPEIEAGTGNPPPMPQAETAGAAPGAASGMTAAGFGGKWVYSPAAEPPRTGLYAPEYIELQILEKDGQVRGLYRARYLVTDRAISPAVMFRFEGRGAAPVSTLRWNGPGGAYGNVTLKLITDDSLEVAWTAARLSGGLGLISGTARLVRRRDP
jgi:hypothetical protein